MADFETARLICLFVYLACTDVVFSSCQAYIEKSLDRGSCYFLDTCVGFSFIIYETSANLFWERTCFSFLGEN